MSRGRGRRALGTAALAAVLAVLAGVPSPASAQQPVDSVRVRILESLQRLGRPPAPDTGFVDTTTAASSPNSSRSTPLQANPRPGAAPAPSTDSIVQALAKLAGYEATQYKGTSAEFDAASKRLTLYGDSTHRATVVRQGTELSADSLIKYDEAEQRIRAEGAPVFRAPDTDAVQSQRVIYDVAENRGTAYGATTRYTQGATWYVQGDLPSVTPGVLYAAHADFTSCALTVPHYHFTANDVKIVAGRILVARPVTLYFADVPVAWLPFFAQSMGGGRASGLLIPRFSINDVVRRGGYHRRVSNVGFYWAMSDYADATVALDWFSGNFTSLTGSVQYRWLKQFMNGSVNFREYWKSEGGTTYAADMNHDWKLDERTSVRASARWSKDGSFVRRNSFEPQELTQSINSSGGFDRRFDWGNVSISGNRDQYLTDDRVETSFPQVQMNISQITLFRAPALRARWYNNLTWSGGASGLRRLTNYNPPDTTSRAAASDKETLQGSATSRFSLGNFGLSQQIRLMRGASLQFPRVLPGQVGQAPDGRPLLAMGSLAAIGDTAFQDVAATDLDWSTSLSYQQTLVGSTTFTPSLGLSGRQRRVDTLDVARSFVAGPTKLTFGARLQSDLFRFFPGVGPFTAIRHKISPSIDFQYAPSVTSTGLQETVFGREAILPNKQITFGMNQTFEAKRRPRSGDTLQVDRPAPGGPAPLEPGRAGLAPDASPAGPPPGGGFLPADTMGGLQAAPAGSGFPTAGLRRAPRAEIVKVLALQTSVVTYDFVLADSARILGRSRLLGFKTTQLTNQIGSDFLQGLSISMAHDLFADSTVNGQLARRRLSLHLASLNLGFSLNNRSAIARGFGLFHRGEPDTVQATRPNAPEEPAVQPSAATNEATVIPRSDLRSGDLRNASAAPTGQGQAVGTWSANFSYSLLRPRSGPSSVFAPLGGGSTSGVSQSLQISFTMKPTQNWDLSWRTSYDVERGTFNDHTLSLTRDIHDWDAHFDFARTTTGNWYFRFDVALKANHDFKFDYRQHNNDLITDPRATTAR